MISLIDALMWCEENKQHNDRKMVSIEMVENMLKAMDEGGTIGIDSVSSWHPVHKSVVVFGDDITDEEQPPIELFFTNINAAETMYLALSSILRHHYTAGLEKLK